jgi:histone acetyltransferase MYST4
MVGCHKCGRSGHPSCLEMNNKLAKAVMLYKWSCLECKVCEACNSKGDDVSAMPAFERWLMNSQNCYSVMGVTEVTTIIAWIREFLPAVCRGTTRANSIGR